MDIPEFSAKSNSTASDFRDAPDEIAGVETYAMDVAAADSFSSCEPGVLT